MTIRTLLLLLLTLAMTGCETYRPLPLSDKVTLAPAVSHLKVNAESLLPGSAPPHRFDPARGLDMTDIAMLAVANNPALKLARDNARIANAQAFAAGLLPDPQFGHARQFPGSGTPGAVSAFNSSLGYELSSLVSHAAYSSASRYLRRKTDLDVLWQEWQVIARARLLFSRSIAQRRLLKWLTENRDLLAGRYDKEKLALAQGNLTRNVLNTALSAWQSAGKQVNALERQQLQTHNDLNALLGLSPDVHLKLVQERELALPDQSMIKQMLATLPRRRPDLLALKSGYKAQDQRYRQAILAQFPALNLAFTAASDTAGLITHGLSLSMSLPLLNGNRGNVAIQQATRQRLHDQYQIRLNTAHAEVKRLLADSRLIASRLHTAQAGIHMMDKAAGNSGRALAAGLVDSAGYTQLQSSRIARHIEVTRLKQSLLADRIALLTVLGGNMDKHTTSSEIPE